MAKPFLLALLDGLAHLAGAEFAHRVLKRHILAMALTAAAICVGLAMTTFLLAAAWIYLLPWVGPVGAPLVLAGALLIVMLVLLLAAAHVRRSTGHDRASLASLLDPTKTDAPPPGKDAVTVALTSFVLGLLDNPK